MCVCWCVPHVTHVTLNWGDTELYLWRGLPLGQRLTGMHGLKLLTKKRKQTLIAAVRKNEPLFALQTNGFHLTEKCNIRLHISPGQLAATLCDNYQVIWTQWKMTFLRKLGQGRAQHESVRLLLFWTAEPDQGSRLIISSRPWKGTKNLYVF